MPKAAAITLDNPTIGAITDIGPVSMDLNMSRKPKPRKTPAMEAYAVNLEKERGFSDSIIAYALRTKAATIVLIRATVVEGIWFEATLDIVTSRLNNIIAIIDNIM
jgi:hypothetical protein